MARSDLGKYNQPTGSNIRTLQNDVIHHRYVPLLENSPKLLSTGVNVLLQPRYPSCREYEEWGLSNSALIIQGRKGRLAETRTRRCKNLCDGWSINEREDKIRRDYSGACGDFPSTRNSGHRWGRSNWQVTSVLTKKSQGKKTLYIQVQL